MKSQENGENYIMRSLIICAHHQILFDLSETDYEDWRWMEVAQDRIQWQAF
jgi:hypothetical protein